MSRDVQITLDAADPRALSTFWAAALGYLHPPPPGYDVDPGADAARLVELGATRVERHDPAPPMGAGHIVIQDPEGNEFCLD